MSDIEKMALDLLISECMVALPRVPQYFTREEAVRALVRALTPPDGFVLVPVEPTVEMVVAGNEAENESKFASEIYGAMLAARPEVKNVND